MSLPDHLEVLSSFAFFPCQGKVVEVYAKDHPENAWGVTCYGVEIYRSAPPAQTQRLPRSVMRLGELSGGDSDSSDPLRVGQNVMVVFLEGDPERPVIAGVLPSQDNPSPYIPTTAELGRSVLARSGVVVETTSDGDAVLTLKADRGVRIRASDGTVLLQIAKSGLSYQVSLGDGLHKALVTEDLIAAFNAHTHAETGATTSPPVPLLTSSILTSKTKAT